MRHEVIEQVKEVLKIEAEAILNLMERVGPEFDRAVQMILKARGRVILTGMGKSGLVARKISATLSSTGTPSLFLHPAEAVHGDLGMVSPDDIVIAISHSGRTGEINSLLPILKNMGAKIIAFTGCMDSPMAEQSNLVIDVGVEREACPMGLAPTASTTAALAMGDALAVVLINARRFDPKDFKRFHPGGSLGERLATSVREVMFTDDHIPMVLIGSKVPQALKEMDAKGIGATLVVGRDRKLRGILTDGDLRRALLNHKSIHSLKVEKIMTRSPKIIDENQTAAEALGIMELYEITHLCIVDAHHRVKGLVHLHDLLGREEFRLNGGFTLTEGLIVDLVTPLKQNGDIDGRGLGRQLDRVLPHVQAVLLAGPYTGEGGNLSAVQRAALMQKALTVIKGQVPVLVWITQGTEQETRETLELLSKTLKTKKYKGQVGWVDTPLYYHSNRGLVFHYRHLTASTPEPWLLHNDPGLINRLARSFKRTNIRTALLKEILGIEKIQGLLYSGSLDRAGNYQKATRARPDFRIYDGDELRFLTHPSLSGVVSAGANLAPRAWSKITEASLNLGDTREDYPDRLQQVWKAGRYLRALLDLYSPQAVPVIKETLSQAGIIESPKCTVQTEDVQEKVRSLTAEMKAFGDYMN